MKRWINGGVAGLVVAVGLAMVWAKPAHAALPELKLSPLKYQEHLELGHSKIGFVEASNPTSTKMHVGVEIAAFRQIDNRGQLEYYDSERLKTAITPALNEFDLGPREAVRLKFTVDPNKLGTGGSYGVIFLRVSSGADAASQINTSARVGTLLIFDVGGTGTKTGHITTVKAPRFIIGSKDISVSYGFKNTGNGNKALAYSAPIQTRLGHGQTSGQAGPFVFPGRERTQTINVKPGNHLGPAFITVKDMSNGGKTAHRLIFIISGLWTWMLPLLVALAIGAYVLWRKRGGVISRRQRRLWYRLTHRKK